MFILIAIFLKSLKHEEGHSEGRPVGENATPVVLFWHAVT